MINLSPENTTRRIGKSQGYRGLSVVDFTYADGTPAMMTLWELTPTERAALAGGANIQIVLLGSAHPPILPTVQP
jgi:hypothetical protein